MNVNYVFWNLVVIVKDDSILLIKRNKNDFQGYVPPGGKIEFPETFFDSARREVLEETGLIVDSLKFKGLSGYINEEKKEQFVYVDFFCNEFHGELIKDGPEGEVEWVPLAEFEKLNIHPDIKIRIENIIKEASFEYQIYWNETEGKPLKKRLDLFD